MGVAGVVCVAVLATLGGLALIAWAGDRVATVLIDTLVKVLLWGFGFGWLKRGGF